jgi:hypothetical protein
MSRILLCLFFTFSSISSFAQHFSIGYNTGVTHWFSINNSKNPFRKATDGQALGWEKGLFGRYGLKNGFAFEIGIEHTSRKMEPSGYWFTCGAGCDRDSVYIIGKRDYYEADISAQHRLVSIKQRFSNSIGLTARPGRLITKSTATSYSRRNEAISPLTNTYYYRQFTLALGLSNTSEYLISRHLAAYATVSASINMLGHLGFHDYRSANARINAVVGLGYRF